MKLANLILEDSVIRDLFIDEVKPFISNIKSKCKNAVANFMNDMFLIRGSNIDNSLDSIIGFYPPKTKKRRPTSSNIRIDNFVEIYRKKIYPQGNKIPSRQRAVFAFKRDGRNPGIFTSGYGNTQFYIFPFDNAKMFQSKTIDDFYSSQPYKSVARYISHKIGDSSELDSIIISSLKDYEELSEKQENNIVEIFKKNVIKKNRDSDSIDSYLSTLDNKFAIDVQNEMDKYFSERNETIDEMNTDNEIVFDGAYYRIISEIRDIRKTGHIIREMLK